MTKNLFRSWEGQAIPEYLVVVAIVAATMLPIVVALGLAIKGVLEEIYNSL